MKKQVDGVTAKHRVDRIGHGYTTATKDGCRFHFHLKKDGLTYNVSIQQRYLEYVGERNHYGYRFADGDMSVGRNEINYMLSQEDPGSYL